MASIPQFRLEANSSSFTSIYNVVTDLLLYADPSQRARLDRLQTFLLNDDISDSRITAEEVTHRQARIRYLMESIDDMNSRWEELGSQERAEHASLITAFTTESDQLGLIFEALQVTEDQVNDSVAKAAIRLEASSRDIHWIMLDEEDKPLAELNVHSLEFTWTSLEDGSTRNRLKVKDLVAKDSRPTTKYSHMIAKQTDWLQEHDLVTVCDTCTPKHC